MLASKSSSRQLLLLCLWQQAAVWSPWRSANRFQGSEQEWWIWGMSLRTGQHRQNRRCDWRDDVMLGLVPAVRSYFWIFNRCPIIPMGLTKQKTHRNAADGSSCPCHKQMWQWNASCTSCLAMSSEPGCFCCQPELMHCLLFPSPRNTRSLKSLISTLPACPLHCLPAARTMPLKLRLN